MSTEEAEERGCLGAGIFAVGLGALLPLFALEGRILADLTRWFLVPLGAPAVGWAHAAGLICVFSFMRHQVRLKSVRDEADEKALSAGDWAVRQLEPLFQETLYVLLAWGSGAFLHGWMPSS